MILMQQSRQCVTWYHRRGRCGRSSSQGGRDSCNHQPRHHSNRTNLEESKAKVTRDTDQAVDALNGRINITNRDLAATQESLHTTQHSLRDCFNEVAVARSDLERNVADTEARLKNVIRQKQQEAFEKFGVVEQQAEPRSAEASRRLGALDLRMSSVQGGLGEHKRDMLKLRKEVNSMQ